MKHHTRGSREPLDFDPDFDNDLDEGRHGPARRQIERKTRLFCGQVQRVLNLALAVRCAGNGLPDELFVEEVIPAPDCGRLLLYVAVPASAPAAEVIRELGRITPYLRSEVAAAVNRKRAPELCFVPIQAEEDSHE
ncbi:MAG: hypothetical protein U0Q16_17865 [Bryobacteraceae bacterium]